jgi:hypothetical protein
MPYAVDVDDNGRITWPPLHVDTGKRMTTDSQDVWRKSLTVLGKRGPITDKSGLASTILAKRIRWKHTPSAFSMHLNNMVDAGLITREVRGRRTFNLALAIDAESLPEDWLPTEETDAPAAVSLDATEAVSEPITPAETNGTGDASVDGVVDVLVMPPADPDEWLRAVNDNGGVDYSLLATALLERVVEVVTHDTGNEDDTYDRATVLSVQLTHANNQAEKLRHRINVLERELAIGAGRLKSYRIELAEERRLHAGTEANLKHVLDGVRRFDANGKMDADKRNALDKLIREVPISAATQRNIG